MLLEMTSMRAWWLRMPVTPVKIERIMGKLLLNYLQAEG
jgi:hypothetical protein